jgi:hypothetical protein
VTLTTLLSDRAKTHGDYTDLIAVLEQALSQAAEGKGKDRHANGRPFNEQPIITIGKMVGPGFPIGQALKKGQEAAGMISRHERQAAKRELLGAINYLAAAVILIDEGNQTSEGKR